MDGLQNPKTVKKLTETGSYRNFPSEVIQADTTELSGSFPDTIRLLREQSICYKVRSPRLFKAVLKTGTVQIRLASLVTRK